MPAAPNSDRNGLLIVGASARAAATSAHRAGFDVAACDLFADRDLAALAMALPVDQYPQGVRRWLKDMAAAAKAARRTPLPWLYTGALENHPELIDAMAAMAPLWGCDGRAVRAARDPAIWCEAFRDAAIAPLPWLPGDRPSPGQGWLFKPAVSGGGAGIRPAEQLTESPKPGFWQKFQPGEPCAAVYVVGPSHALFLGLTRQVIGQSWYGASGFQYCGSYGPWLAPQRHPAGLRQLHTIGEVLRRLGMRGLVGVDLIVTTGGPQGSHQFWPVEINPRYTASVEVLEIALPFALFQDAFHLHRAACMGEPLPKAIDFEGGQAAKAILFARRDVKVDQRLSDAMMDAAWCVPDKVDKLPALPIADDIYGGVADIPQPGTVIERGRPICTLLTWSLDRGGDSERRVRQTLQRYAAQWESQIYIGTVS